METLWGFPELRSWSGYPICALSLCTYMRSIFAILHANHAYVCEEILRLLCLARFIFEHDGFPISHSTQRCSCGGSFHNIALILSASHAQQNICDCGGEHNCIFSKRFILDCYVRPFVIMLGRALLLLFLTFAQASQWKLLHPSACTLLTHM